MKILLVEDDPISRKVISKGLQKVGYEMLEADCARDAISLLEKNADIDLLITDVRMPEMDGLEFLDYVRNQGEWPNLPALVYSSLADRETVQQAAKYNIEAYLVKPIDLHHLRKTIQEVLGRESGPLGNVKETLDRLDLDKKSYRELLEALMRQLELGMLKLAKCVEDRNYDAFETYLEDLVAAAQNLGAGTISQLLQQMGRFVQASDLQAYESGKAKCQESIIELRTAIVALGEED